MGNKNSIGRIVSKETRAKLSKSKSGKPTWNKGKKLSETHKHNIGKAQEGENNSFFHKQHSDNTKRIISEKSKNMHELRKLKQIA